MEEVLGKTSGLIRELVFRDFYMNIIHNFPRVLQGQLKGKNKSYKEQYDNNCQWFMDLFSQYKKTKYNKTQIYELYISIRKINLEYIKTRYDELYKLNKLDLEYQKFLNNFDNYINIYFQLIANKYLPKPLTQIKYVFLAFKKTEKDNKVSLEPFIFNVKELKKEHQSILKRIERLIKHELPYRFDI